MTDVPAQLPAPPCAKWLWDLLQNPRITRYRRVTKRFRVVSLIAYSGDCGTPGLITDTDGAIAHAIGLDEDLDTLHELLSDMIAKKDLRAFVQEDGIRCYEISRRILPTYQGDRRDTAEWDTPRPVLTVTDSSPHFLEVDVVEGGKRPRGGNHKWEIQKITAAEKVAFGRYCQTQKAQAEREGRRAPVISRDKWLVAYQALKPGERLPGDVDVTFETDENANFKSYKSNTSPVTFDLDGSRVDDGDADSVTFKEHHHQQSSCEPKVTDQSSSKVTEAKVTEAKVTEAKVTTSEVYDYFLSEGLWQEYAERAATWCPLDDARIYVFSIRAAIAREGGDFGKLLGWTLDNKHPLSLDARKAYAAAVFEEKKRREAEERKRREAEATETVAVAWEMASDEEKDLLCKQAVVLLGGESRKWWHDFLERRKREPTRPPIPILQSALDLQIDDLLREMRQLPMRDKGTRSSLPCAVPGAWRMPEGWNGTAT